MMEDPESLIVVYSGSAIDADFVRMVLEAEGIESFLRDEHMGTIAPFYIAAAGAGAVKVLVLREDLPKAEQIVRDFLRNDPAE